MGIVTTCNGDDRAVAVAVAVASPLATPITYCRADDCDCETCRINGNDSRRKGGRTTPTAMVPVIAEAVVTASSCCCCVGCTITRNDSRKEEGRKPISVAIVVAVAVSSCC